MKINEVLKEGFYDNPSTSNATGQKYFIDSVTKQINAYIDSVRKSGTPLQIWDFVNSYLTKYGWTANPQQQEMLKKLSKDVENEYNYFLTKQQKPEPKSTGSKAFDQMANQLSTSAADKQSSGAFGQMASQLTPQQQNWKPSQDSASFFKSGRTGKSMNEGVLDWAKAKAGTMAGALASKMGLGSVSELVNAMYAVGMTQHRDPRTGQAMSGRMQGQQPEDTTLDPQGQQILKSLKPLKGPKYEQDLKDIIKLAMWNLHGTDKQDYSEFMNSIMNQKSSAKNPAQQQQNPTV